MFREEERLVKNHLPFIDVLKMVRKTHEHIEPLLQLIKTQIGVELGKTEVWCENAEKSKSCDNRRNKSANEKKKKLDMNTNVS